MNQWQSLKRNQGCCARISAAVDSPAEENPGTASAEAGKVTAIIGPSGAGKSTVLNLVERLYHPGEGKILWGGQEANKYDLYSWRRSIGYIPQDTQLFAGTIRDNITQGVQGTVSEERIREAAQQADALEFIEGFEKGFDTEVGENGTKLSGGEKQRIAIARMMIRDPEYLLLDEATSSLDAQNEAMVMSALGQLMKGRTCIVVAHNLRTVENADNIIFMEKGKVVSTGSHEELYRENEKYRRYVDL